MIGMQWHRWRCGERVDLLDKTNYIHLHIYMAGLRLCWRRGLKAGEKQYRSRPAEVRKSGVEEQG